MTFVSSRYAELRAKARDPQTMADPRPRKQAEQNLRRHEKCLDVPDALVPIAKELDCTVAQLCLAWCCTNPNVSTTICGATSTQ